MSRQIIVDIIGDSSKFTGAIDKAESKSRSFKNVLGGIGAGIGMAAFNLVAAGVGKVIDVMGDADKAYQQDMASQSKLAASLRANVAGWDGSTAAIEDTIASRVRLGFEDDAQRASLATLTGITHDATKALELQATAMDLARFKNIDLQTASDLLGKVYAGNMGALSRYGIVLGENATKEEALAAIQKMAGGQAEAYATGPLGMAEAAQLRNAESMEKLGKIVNQVSSVVLPLVADAFTVVIDVVTDLWTAIGPVVSAVLSRLVPAFQTVVGFIRGTVMPIVGQVIGVIGGIYTAIFSVYQGIGTAIGNIVGLFTRLPGQIGGAVRGMFDGIWQAFKSALNSVIAAWNSIKFTFPEVDLGPLGKFGGFVVGTPNLPYFHRGGIVPGVPGTDVPIMAQAGERIVPRDRADASGETHYHVHIEGLVRAESPEDIGRTLRRLSGLGLVGAR